MTFNLSYWNELHLVRGPAAGRTLDLRRWAFGKRYLHVLAGGEGFIYVVDPFLDFVQSVWPGRYSKHRTEESLTKTINVTAWDGELLVGCARILTDGYFFGTVAEILVRPSYQGRGIGTM